jgi:hypothetical protein
MSFSKSPPLQKNKYSKFTYHHRRACLFSGHEERLSAFLFFYKAPTETPPKLPSLVDFHQMKSHAGLIIAAAAGVLGLPAQQVLTGAPVAYNLEWLENKDLPVSWPGIDLDLNERRLVQLENTQEPVWMTELEKVSFSQVPGSLTRSQHFQR